MLHENVKDISTIHLSSNIRILRKSMGLSQGELAKLVELNRGNIASYENGSAEPRICSLVKLAHVFGVSLVDFILLDMQDQEALSIATQKFQRQGEKDKHILEDCHARLEELNGVMTSLKTCHQFKKKEMNGNQEEDLHGFSSRFDDLYDVADKLMSSHQKLIDFVRCRLQR